MRSDQIAANEDWGAAYGLAVVSDQAVAIGVTAVPTPDTDRGSDLWYVYEETYGHFTFTTGVGYIEGGASNRYDSKAMRKVEIGQDLVIVAETPSGVNSALITDAGRFLVKLH